MVQLPSNPSTSAPSPPPNSPVSSVPPIPWDPDADGPDWDILEEEWLSDEPELESDFHRDQIDLLVRLMKWYWRQAGNVYCSGNTTVYYDQDQRTNRNFRGPDIFVVMNANPRQRNSWMIWKEGGRYPNVVFELLSNSTAKVDRTTKKDLYQDVWRLPNYFWFHPVTKELKGFKLINNQYQEIQPNVAGHLWSDQMELFVGLHDGILRLFTANGDLVLLEEEEAQRQAAAAQQQAEQAQQQAEQERQRAERLAEQLRQLGVDPDSM